MIFNTDNTSLSSNVPMIEGYDCSIGSALALIDSARNDRAMFEAMLSVEAEAVQLENSGYVNEAEYTVLQENAITGIFKKIADLFKKLAEKIKTIFHNFFSKINSIFLTDKQMVKKYEKEIYRKVNLGKLEIKWRKHKSTYKDMTFGTTTVNQNWVSELGKDWKEDKEDRDEIIYKGLGMDFIEADNVNESYIDHFFEDEEKDDLNGLNLTPRGILSALNDNFPKKIRNAERDTRKLITDIEKMSKQFNKDASAYSKNGSKSDWKRPEIDTGDGYYKGSAGEYLNKDFGTGKNGKSDDGYGSNGLEYSDNEMTRLNHLYDMSVAYQDCQTKINAAYIDALKIDYKQHKAAMMKMISANDKKLEATEIWADAIAEAAAEEVEDVLSSAIDKETISSINNASKSLMDSSVSDDPNMLTYGDDPSYKKARTSGTIDSNIVGKNESAYFGEMLY